MKDSKRKISRIQSLFTLNEVEFSLLREDELHPVISGNKFRKMKYNLEEFSQGNFSTLLTFGGAYSNHIAAVAGAGKEFGFETIGIIRGEELQEKIAENPTLQFAQDCGMKFKFISRSDYRKKNTVEFLAGLQSEFGQVYILPEGGTNEFAIRGCEEILNENTYEFDCICLAVGTGGTIAGIANSAESHQKIIGFPALKSGDFLYKEINKWTQRCNFELILDYHFGGYGKLNQELIQFINDFKQQYNVSLDPIYTGKMVFGVVDLIQKNYFPPKTKILAIHTGGLQGIEGMNQKLERKNKMRIE